MAFSCAPFTEGALSLPASDLPPLARTPDMNGLMMDVPLSIPMMVRRALTVFPDRPVLCRRPDKTILRST